MDPSSKQKGEAETGEGGGDYVVAIAMTTMLMECGLPVTLQVFTNLDFAAAQGFIVWGLRAEVLPSSTVAEEPAFDWDQGQVWEPGSNSKIRSAWRKEIRQCIAAQSRRLHPRYAKVVQMPVASEVKQSAHNTLNPKP